MANHMTIMNKVHFNLSIKMIILILNRDTELEGEKICKLLSLKYQ